MALKNGVPHSKDLKEGIQPGEDEFEQRQSLRKQV